jgi:hypothetical protein
VNVAQQFQQVAVRIDQDCSIAAFKEMTRGPIVALHMARKSAANSHHCPTQRRVTDLHGEVHVIGHPTERMHAHVKAFDHLRDNLCEPITIGRTIENGLSVVAT